MPRLRIECDDATAQALRALLEAHPGVSSIAVEADEPPPCPDGQMPEWCVNPAAPHATPLRLPLRHEHLTVHTDGSCSGNPGPTGMSVVVHDRARVKAGFGWGGGHGTSPQAEVSAVLAALNLAASRRVREVTVTTDSEYVTKGVSTTSKKWEREGFQGVPNGEIWQCLLRQKAVLERAGVRVTVQWTRGHDGQVFNERADRLAVRARKAQAYIRDDTT